MDKSRVRLLNGYRVLYEPDHPNCMKSCNWKGYIYEHILVAIENMGRPLHSNEVVHHLDGNRSNNRSENLLVLDRAQHYRLHNWLDAGAPFSKEDGMQGMNSGNSKAISYCEICERTLQEKQKRFCSNECQEVHRLSTNDRMAQPDKETLVSLLEDHSQAEISRMYNVSHTSVRRWQKKYDLL